MCGQRARSFYFLLLLFKDNMSSTFSALWSIMQAHVTTKGFIASVALFILLAPGGFLPWSLPFLGPVDIPIVSSRALWVHGGFFALALLVINSLMVHYNLTSYYKKHEMQSRHRRRA